MIVIGSRGSSDIGIRMQTSEAILLRTSCYRCPWQGELTDIVSLLPSEAKAVYRDRDCVGFSPPQSLSP